LVWHEFNAWTGPRIITWWHIFLFAKKIGGDIPIGGVILIPTILGGEIYQMQRYIIEKEPYI
jgi:hypothetical protein